MTEKAFFDMSKLNTLHIQKIVLDVDITSLYMQLFRGLVASMVSCLDVVSNRH